MSVNLLALLEERVEANNLSTKIKFASLSILVWDYLLTLNLEISLVWSKKFTGGTLLFFLTRYLPFTDLFITIIRIQLMDAGDSRSTCPGPYAAVVWLEVAGIQIAELILVLRTWALYNRNKWILAGLLMFQMGTLVYCGVFDEKLIRSLVWGGPEWSGVPGCIILSAENLRARLAGNYLLIVAFETCILILTCIKAFSFRRETKRITGGSFLMHIIHRDGLIFYFFILAISIANVIVIFIVPQVYIVVLVIFQRTMHSVATGRALLHIRQVAASSVIQVEDYRGSLQVLSGWELETFSASIPPSLPPTSSQPDVTTAAMTVS
ncbi:hypothetical protein DL96DRAFT_1628808 [Flagelloscypha sp. PMI_526]|nr:hypothetical protein DL96DRAFT_1628808 [Flagelloscypha sp. PMI_526]